MKVSQLISQMAKILDEQGDIDVIVAQQHEVDEVQIAPEITVGFFFLMQPHQQKLAAICIQNLQSPFENPPGLHVVKDEPNGA